jgi:predicted esterase
METELRRLYQEIPVRSAGVALAQADSAMVLLHGRGATAESILELAAVLPYPGMAYLAPQAVGNSWYPHSFTAALDKNEPMLSLGLGMIAQLIAEVEAGGVPAGKIVLAGFSQGACLVSEFVARHARQYGALLVFSGGLIGPRGTPRDYSGDLDGTPVLIACSDSDPHIPLWRVHETTTTFWKLGAQVHEAIYPDMGHTIIPDEIALAKQILETLASS